MEKNQLINIKYFTSPIPILLDDIKKYEIYRTFLLSFKSFLGEELYYLLNLYRFFLPNYFLRIIFKYASFSDIFGPELLSNIHDNKYDDTFIYLSEIKDMETFIFTLYTLSLTDTFHMNQLKNDIKPIYNKIFITPFDAILLS
jgi:hypothetical protein